MAKSQPTSGSFPFPPPQVNLGSHHQLSPRTLRAASSLIFPPAAPFFHVHLSSHLTSAIVPKTSVIILVLCTNNSHDPMAPWLFSVASLAFESHHHHFISPTTSFSVPQTQGFNHTKESQTPNTSESFTVPFPLPGILFYPCFDGHTSHPSRSSSGPSQQSRQTVLLSKG